MDSIQTIVAAEAAKTVAAYLAGVATSGAVGLVKHVTNKIRALPHDRASIEAAIRDYAKTDPEFMAELAAKVAALRPDGLRPVCPFPPDPYYDRDQARAQLAQASGAWVVVGQVGAGKTAFVRRVAHDVAEQFPDGQIYLDLDEWRSGGAARHAEVKGYVLRRFGAPVVEAAEPELNDQYRAALTLRRFVLVLDNVKGVDEVRALVDDPPWRHSLVLVTTSNLSTDMRSRFKSNVVLLHGLDEPGAHGFLAAHLPDRGLLDAEPDATRQLLTLCDRMPFAIAQIGVELGRRAGEPGAVRAVVREFEEIAADGDLIQAHLARTFTDLTAATVDDIATLARHRPDGFTYHSAEWLLGPSARRTVSELVDAGLAEPDDHQLRLHRLVRQHAERHYDGRGDDRALDRYLERAVAADVATMADRLRPLPVPPGVRWTDQNIDAVDWLETDSATIVGMVKLANLRGRHETAVKLCGGLEVLLLHRTGHEWRCAEAFEVGVRSADALGEALPRARMYASLGRVYTLLHWFPRAAECLDTASRVGAGLSDPRLDSSLLEFHGRLCEERGDVPAAIDFLRRAVAIDRQSGLHRPLRIHLRMLGNALVRDGRPAEALAGLDEIWYERRDPRNEGRDHTVRAKAYLELGELGRAQAALDEARSRYAAAGALTRYELELADVEAEIAFRLGDMERARALWGAVATRYYLGWGHPKATEILEKLSRLPSIRE
ncbi:hypothetical protein WEI85_40520 [Actinomycetes bacterium KLBMP 9797]